MQKGIFSIYTKAPWFYFFHVITYDLLRTFLIADFTGFFFPSGFGVWKKKTVASFLEFGLVVKPVQELDRWQIYVIKHRKKTVDFPCGFFFQTGSRRKKKTVKLCPSYLLFYSTYTFVCGNRENKKPWGSYPIKK